MATVDRKNSDKYCWLSGAAAVLAFISCNGLFIIVATLAWFDITVAVDSNVQAALISLFTLLALGFVFRDYSRHQVLGPMLLSALGALLIVGTMYVNFSKTVESVGLIALISSTIWNWRAIRTRNRRDVGGLTFPSW